ncbi:PstS family phosphate ABC transporter substrate-binding protein [Luteimonas huabeiensis]|uniref:PstS family phosphate ABC transporter substrate-binding protein n=1 Tax=Luteimonas huabeiensis TaxID=1244513 RepID=UPI0004AD73DF|nr:substrate-binding domain-containing protein [Luteimonas huabeiensis]
MSSDLQKLVLSFNLLAALALAGGSANAGDLYGGGATFPVQSYVGYDFLTTLPVDARLSRNTVNPVATTPIANLTPPNSLFARFIANGANRISYCQSGSGIALSLLTGSGSVTDARGECGNYVTGNPLGYSAPSIAPDYIATDIPINQANATAFVGGPRAARGSLWQIPTLAGSIAFPRHAALNFPNLTTQQICQVFSARITNWSQIPGSASNAPIHVVYRQDSSGTTFAFTSFLSRACNGNFGLPPGYFTPGPVFAAAVPAVPGQPGTVAPTYAASSATSGDPGLVARVNATVNTVGYAAFAEVAAQGVEYPTVNGISPGSLPASIAIPAPLSGQVLNANNQPVPVAGLSNPHCLRLVNPITRPAGAAMYPILAYTYLAGYRSNSVANRDALRNLLGYFLATQANRPAPPAGFAYLDVSLAYRVSLQNAINTCIL